MNQHTKIQIKDHLVTLHILIIFTIRLIFILFMYNSIYYIVLPVLAHDRTAAPSGN